MTSVKLLLVFAFVATLSLCLASPSRFDQDLDVTAEELTRVEKRSGGSSRRSSSLVGSSLKGSNRRSSETRFPRKDLILAAEQFHEVTEFLDYMRGLSDDIADQMDFEMGQFIRIIHQVTLDAHNLYPEKIPSLEQIHESFPLSFAVAMGNYTLPTQEKLRSTIRMTEKFHTKVSPVVDLVMKHKDDTPADFNDAIAEYIANEKYGAQEVDGLYNFGELEKTIDAVGFRNVENEVALSAGAFVLTHRSETEELVYSLEVLWHSVAMLDDPSRHMF